MSWKRNDTKIGQFLPGIPKHEQLARFMAEDMKAGRLCEGDYLPAQHVLAEIYSISVLTVDMAYVHLRKYNLIGRDVSRRYRVKDIARAKMLINSQAV